MRPYRSTLILTAILVLAVRFQAQSLPLADADPAAGADSSAADPGAPAPDEQLLTPKLLLRNTVKDQKRIWLFPVTAAHGNGWKPALGVIGITAGLIDLIRTIRRFSAELLTKGTQRFTVSVTF